MPGDKSSSQPQVVVAPGHHREKSTVAELAALGGDIWKGFAEELQLARRKWAD
jgi:hypothetical protein